MLLRFRVLKRTRPAAIAARRSGTFGGGNMEIRNEQGPMQHPQPVAAINGCDPKGVPG